jgi:hypothetical protein
LARSGSRIPNLLARVGRWWLAEFLALFPDRWSEWLTDRRIKKLTVQVAPDFVVLQLLSDRRWPHAASRATLIRQHRSTIS